MTVLSNFYLSWVSETPLPAPHLECSVEKRISADVPGPMIKTALSMQEVQIWCLVWELRSAYAVLCSQKEKKKMEEREGERNQRKKRQCPVQSIEGIYHVWSFHFLWEEFYRWNENCPDFIGNVKLFFVKHIWSCKWKGISCLSWKFWCFVQCVYFGIFIF